MSAIIQIPENLVIDREEIKSFRTPLPEHNEQRARHWARIFNVHGEIVDLGQSYVIRDEQGDLEIFHASDSLWWTDVPAMNREPQGPVNLPGEEEAIAIANAFLQSHELFDDSCRVEAITYAEAGRIVTEEIEPELFRVAMRVNYTFSLEGLPVWGPGAKIGVTIGAENRVIEVFKFWREPVEDRAFPLLNPEAAARLLMKDAAFAQLKEGEASVKYHHFQPGYYALPCMECQAFLGPVYQFSGTVTTPARKETPLLRHVIAVPLSTEEMKKVGGIFQEIPRVF